MGVKKRQINIIQKTRKKTKKNTSKINEKNM